MSEPCRHEKSNVEPLCDVIGRVVEHVSGLSVTLSATEDFMTEHFHDILTVRPHAMEDFQRLDFLNQSIIDTARLLRNLSRGCLDQANLLRDVQLESTRDLIVEGKAPPEGQASDGDVQLF